MKNLTKNPIKKLLAVVTFVGVASTSAIAAPRTLANGAPAPGNTVAKGKPRVDRSARAIARARELLASALTEKQDAARALASAPRTLPNGAPACGNTGGKAPECTDEMAAGMYQARIDRTQRAEVAVQRAREQLHEVTRKVATAKQNRTYASYGDDDYS